jgi:5-deoxy-glucuronate isomerase
MTTEQIAKDTCIVRNTAARKGRTQAVVPGKTATKYLHYGRIILDAGDAPMKFDTNDRETGLICLKGSATVRTGDQSFTLGRFDSLYVPRDASIEVTPGSDGCDLAELAAPVGRPYPVQFVPYQNVKKDPGLHLNVGSATSQREVSILIGKNVEAGRLLAGITFSQPGNWTSWPPHEHAAMLEEAYLYIDMPAPSYGVQLVYTDTKEPELATIVREGDVVLMPAGYHPNVAAPGGSINFLWMMAANREREDRQYGVVNVQPDFASVPAGIDKLRADR